MNIKLLSVPVVLTGGVGGTYLTYQYLQKGKKKESIKSRLNSFLLGFDNSFDSKWTERATLLTAKNDLHQSLEDLRDSNRTISKEKLRGWCQVQGEKNYTSDTDPIFTGIRSYCTFNNKDKLRGNAISESLENGNNLKNNGSWAKANKRLKEQQGSLSTKMTSLKTELSKESGANDKVLKIWCESTYTKYFKSFDDQEFKDLESYCKVEELPTLP